MLRTEDPTTLGGLSALRNSLDGGGFWEAAVHLIRHSSRSNRCNRIDSRLVYSVANSLAGELRGDEFPAANCLGDSTAAPGPGAQIVGTETFFALKSLGLPLVVVLAVCTLVAWAAHSPVDWRQIRPAGSVRTTEARSPSQPPAEIADAVHAVDGYFESAWKDSAHAGPGPTSCRCCDA